MTEAQFTRYIPKRKLRSVGAYYSAFEATQSGLDRPVELRVLNVKFQPGSPEVVRFENEFKAIAQLDHPGLARVLDLGVLEDHIFYVTDFRQARSLQEIIEHGRTFTPDEVLGMGLTLAGALAHLHSRRLLHRDLSLRTVWVDLEAGRPYIAEFSMVKNLASAGLTGRGIPYMAELGRTPELVSGLPFDHRTDIYLLGAVLYRLLASRDPPWPSGPGAPPPSDELAHPRLVNPVVPEELGRVVARALRWDPQGRYPSASEMAADLERAVLRGQTRAEASRILELSSANAPRRADLSTTLTLTVGRKKEPPAPPAPPGNVTKAVRVLQIVGSNRALLLGLGALLFVVGFVGVNLGQRGLSASADGAQLSPPGGRPRRPGGVAAGDGRVSSVAAPPVAAPQGIDHSAEVRKIADTLGRDPTSKENFHQRWYLLDNWLKQAQGTSKAPPFTTGDLVNVRINFYRDEKEAAEKLDALYQRASDHLGP